MTIVHKKSSVKQLTHHEFSNPPKISPKPSSSELLPFAELIRREFIEGSAIPPDLFKAAVEFVKDTGYWETHQALGFEVRTQWQTRKPHDFGILTGLKNEDDSFWQFKPENPLTDSKGKAQKYQTATGNGSRAFLPRVPLAIRRKIAKRYDINDPGFAPNRHHRGRGIKMGSFWHWLEIIQKSQSYLQRAARKPFVCCHWAMLRSRCMVHGAVCWRTILSVVRRFASLNLN